MILGFVLAGTQVALPQYNEVIKERPLLGQDYPSHYTHYSVPEKILNFNVEFWVDLRRDEKIDLIRTISKINDSIAVSKAYKELFNVEKDVSIKKEILSNLVYSKPVTRTQTWLKSLISSKEFKKEAFKAFAVHASSNEIQSYIQNDLELLIIAAGLGKVNDAQILLKNYDSLKAIHDQAVFVTQLAFLKHDEAFRLCKSYYLQLKFVSSSTSTEFLIKQSKIKALAQASLIRMKELGWNLQFNNRAKEIINSDQSELKTSACEILIMHESNAAFLARNLNKMDTPTGLTALKFFEENPVIKSYENDFCKMKLGSDAINIAKINIFEDQYIIAAKDEVSRVLEKSRNPELIRAALRYLGLMKFKVNNLQRFVKDRNIRVQEGLVFYLACSTNSPSVKEFDKYIKSPDMKIRRAFTMVWLIILILISQIW